MKKSLFLLAGEKSGDLLGSALVEKLQESDYQLWGVGGKKMEEKGLEVIYPMEKMQMMGFVEVIRRLPELFKQFKIIKKAILEKNPEACILIDYPGFNLRLAKNLRKSGYKGKIIQYVSPTVWVWGKGRIKTLEKYFDHLLTILPFEKKLFENTTLDVTYVGHPIAEEVEKYRHENPTKTDSTLLALFPGSRRKELDLNLDLEISLAEKLQKKIPDLKVALSCSNESFIPYIEEKLSKSTLSATINRDEYALMNSCQAAIAKSGTVTLELGLFETPAVVVYQLDWFTKLIARYLLKLKIPFVCMTNILAGKEVFPEYVTRPFTEDEVVEALTILFKTTKQRTTCKQSLKDLKKELSTGSVCDKAANAILSHLNDDNKFNKPIQPNN